MNAADYGAQRQRMVASQLAARDITDLRVLAAMGAVPRHEFVPSNERTFAYSDRALPIGLGQTISQPYMVALMCQLLGVGPDDTVLEVGGGSGYQAAILGELAAEVHAIEIVPELAQRSRETLRRLGYRNVYVHSGDGTVGLPDQAPFDRIIIAAATPEVPPPLVEQLVQGGKLVAPVGTRGGQVVVVATREGGAMRTEKSIACVFVPLLGEHGWPGSSG